MIKLRQKLLIFNKLKQILNQLIQIKKRELNLYTNHYFLNLKKVKKFYHQ